MILPRGNGALQINPETGKIISLTGTVGCCCGTLYVYEGIGTNGKQYGSYRCKIQIPLLVSNTGPMTIKFNNNHDNIILLSVGCIINTLSIYNLVKIIIVQRFHLKVIGEVFKIKLF